MTMKPVTPTLSVAVRVIIGTVKVVDVAGMLKAVTVGGFVSAPFASAISAGRTKTAIDIATKRSHAIDGNLVSMTINLLNDPN